MGSCIYPRKGRLHYEPLILNATFSSNDWATIAKACKNNAVPSTWKVGDYKQMKINGTDYRIDIIGKSHDNYANNGGKAPLTFMMHDSYGTTYSMNTTATNVGGWMDCNMRNTHLTTILGLMPSDVSSAIKEVEKFTSVGNKSSSIVATKDKLFLLSEIEVHGSRTYSVDGEGSQYEYFAAGNSKVKKYNSSAYVWANRSPNINYATAFCRTAANGNAATISALTVSGVAFAFCF